MKARLLQTLFTAQLFFAAHLLLQLNQTKT